MTNLPMNHMILNMRMTVMSPNIMTDGAIRITAADTNAAVTADAVMTALESQSLTEKDAQYVRGFQADLLARADSIKFSDYNQRVDQFNQQILGRFPANLLGRLTFVREAQAFR